MKYVLGLSSELKTIKQNTNSNEGHELIQRFCCCSSETRLCHRDAAQKEFKSKVKTRTRFFVR